MEDRRYEIIKSRLERLNDEQLLTIVSDIDLICLDEFNYDQSSGKCCILAVGLGLHRSIINPTDDIIKKHLSKYFNPVNALKGVRGKFFTDNRREDLLSLTQEILFERKCKLK